MMRLLIRVCISAMVAAIVGCQPARPRMSSDEQAIAEIMAGNWEMRFSLEQSPMISLDSKAAPRTIDGRLSLLRNRSLNRSFPRVGVPTNYGSYDIDLTPFGFDPRTAAATPTAVAGRLSRDSIEIILSPDSQDERLVLAGKLEGGTITGIWHVSLSTTGGGGRFVMQRTEAAAR